MKEGRKPEYPEKTPHDELRKMPHIYSPSRDSNPHSSTGGRRLLRKQTYSPLHHASPHQVHQNSHLIGKCH